VLAGRAALTLMLCAVLHASVARAGPLTLAGPYKVGDLGVLDVSTQDGKVRGRYRSGGSCDFPQDVLVLQGEFEGNVFVGTVLLCQEGPACEPERTYPFLGVWYDGALAGEVKLAPGCHSKVLEGRQLRLAALSAEERSALGNGNPTTAAQIAARNQNKQQLQESAAKALQSASLKLQQGDYRAAAQLFERGVSYDEENWMAHMGLGMAELKLNNADKAMGSLESALKLGKMQKAPDHLFWQAYFNLACAQARKGQRKDAIISLRLALKLAGPGTIADDLESEPDFAPLKQDSEFKRLVADARGTPAPTGKKPKGGRP